MTELFQSRTFGDLFITHPVPQPNGSFLHPSSFAILQSRLPVFISALLGPRLQDLGHTTLQSHLDLLEGREIDSLAVLASQTLTRLQLVDLLLFQGDLGLQLGHCGSVVVSLLKDRNPGLVTAGQLHLELKALLDERPHVLLSMGGSDCVAGQDGAPHLRPVLVQSASEHLVVQGALTDVLAHGVEGGPVVFTVKGQGGELVAELVELRLEDLSVIFWKTHSRVVWKTHCLVVWNTHCLVVWETHCRVIWKTYCHDGRRRLVPYVSSSSKANVAMNILGGLESSTNETENDAYVYCWEFDLAEGKMGFVGDFGK